MVKKLSCLLLSLFASTWVLAEPSVNDLTPVCMTPYCAGKVISVGGQLQDTATFEELESRATSQGLISVGTADAADSKSNCLSGGGACAASRGGSVQVYGNEASGQTGDTQVDTGNASGAILYLRALGSAGSVAIAAGSSTTDWTVEADGDIIQAATSGDLVLTTASTAVLQPAATTLTAAGSAIGDALQLTSVYNNVTTVAASTGVKLFDKASKVGYSIIVRNSGANALAIYPPDASGTINGGSAGASVSCAATEVCHLTKVAANTWIGGVMVVF